MNKNNTLKNTKKLVPSTLLQSIHGGTAGGGVKPVDPKESALPSTQNSFETGILTAGGGVHPIDPKS